MRFWEFFIVTAIVVAFSVFMEAYFNEFLVANFAALISWFGGGGMQRKTKAGESVFQVVQSIIHELTYAEVEHGTGLTEAGLSSMTTIILVSGKIFLACGSAQWHVKLGAHFRLNDECLLRRNQKGVQNVKVDGSGRDQLGDGGGVGGSD